MSGWPGPYVFAPFVAWATAGTLKFFVNAIRSGRKAVGLVGYGGFPSNHTSIVTATTALVGMREGISEPAFGVGLTLSFIVIMDALSLRRRIGDHATAINRLRGLAGDEKPLRERIGHHPVEVAGGLVVGVLCAWVVNALFA